MLRIVSVRKYTGKNSALVSRLFNSVLIALSFMMMAGLVSGQDRDSVAGFLLKDGVIAPVYKVTGQALETGGIVLAACHQRHYIWYIRQENTDPVLPGDQRACHLGRIESGVNVSPLEISLPDDFYVTVDSQVKMTAYQSAVFVLVKNQDEKIPGTLYRISLVDGSVQKKEGVLDFCLMRGKTVLIQYEHEKLFLNINSFMIPSYLSDSAQITHRVKNRLVVLSDGKATEVYDIESCRAVYSFAQGMVSSEDASHNIVIRCIDRERGEGLEKLLFYKVYINGSLQGRTDTGPAGADHFFRAGLETDRYNIIKLERFELDVASGVYKRLNNVEQPALLRVYVPSGRIIDLELVRDSEAYRVAQSSRYSPVKQE